MKRGQISVEYLIVVGFIVFIVVGLLGVAFIYASNIRDELKNSQLNNFAEKLLNSAESVYYSGDPSKVTITAYLPEAVKSVVLDSGENSLVFTFESSAGESVIAFQSDVPLAEFDMNNEFNEGLRSFVITAEADGVHITVN